MNKKQAQLKAILEDLSQEVGSSSMDMIHNALELKEEIIKESLTQK